MNARSLTLACGLAVAAAAPLSAQADLGTRVDAVFAEFDRPDSPGCAVGVVRDGELVYARGYGMANLARREPITPGTVFYLASVSKQFTAASAALLALEGQLALDNDVRRHVPELPDYGRAITVRHLIHHTSGLRDYLELMGMAVMSLDEPRAPADILALVARQEDLNFPPGERYLYSNTGYFLIPRIVARVTGRGFRAWTDTHLFGPLGMARSHFHDDWRHDVPQRALAYAGADTGGFRLDYLPHFDQVGSGGVLSTVEDLARWVANYERPRLGGTRFIELMHTRGVLADGDTLDYAFGLRLGDYKGLRIVEHGGSMMGFRTHLLRFPDERLAVICLCNLADAEPGTRARRVADLHLAGRLAAALAPYAGRYTSRELGVSWTVRVRDADLLVERAGEDPVTLEPLEGGRFRVRRGVELRFERTDGAVTGFILDGRRARGIRFTRVGA